MLDWTKADDKSPNKDCDAIGLVEYPDGSKEYELFKYYKDNDLFINDIGHEYISDYVKYNAVVDHYDGSSDTKILLYWAYLNEPTEI